MSSTPPPSENSHPNILRQSLDFFTSPTHTSLEVSRCYIRHEHEVEEFESLEKYIKETPPQPGSNATLQSYLTTPTTPSHPTPQTPWSAASLPAQQTPSSSDTPSTQGRFMDDYWEATQDTTVAHTLAKTPTKPPTPFKVRWLAPHLPSPFADFATPDIREAKRLAVLAKAAMGHGAVNKARPSQATARPSDEPRPSEATARPSEATARPSSPPAFQVSQASYVSAHPNPPVKSRVSLYQPRQPRMVAPVLAKPTVPRDVVRAHHLSPPPPPALGGGAGMSDYSGVGSGFRELVQEGTVAKEEGGSSDSDPSNRESPPSRKPSNTPEKQPEEQPTHAEPPTHPESPTHPEPPSHSSPPSRKPIKTPEARPNPHPRSNHFSPPSRKPTKTPQKYHSSPPSRRPLPTPEKAKVASAESPPSRRPLPTPEKAEPREQEEEQALASPALANLVYQEQTLTVTPATGAQAPPPAEPLAMCFESHPNAVKATTLPLSNRTEVPVTLSFDVKGEKGPFRVEPTQLLLQPGATDELVCVTYSGTVTASAILSITSDVVGVDVENVSLHGVVVPVPRVEVSRDAIEWRDGGGTSRLIKVRNAGTDAVTVLTEVEGGDGRFEMVGGGGGMRLEGGAVESSEVGLWVRCAAGSQPVAGRLSISVSVASRHELSGDLVCGVEPTFYDIPLSVSGEEETGRSVSPPPELPVDGLRQKLMRFNGMDVSDIWDTMDEDEDAVEIADTVQPSPTSAFERPKAKEKAPPLETVVDQSDTLKTVVGLDFTLDSRSNSSMAEEGGRVFFRRSVVEFGTQALGTCGSMRLQLCNSTSKEIVARVCEPAAPFVVLHKKIRIKSKSFVRLPVRFIPMGVGVFETLLSVDVDGGSGEVVVLLRGAST